MSFEHIDFDDYQIGTSYEFKDGEKIVNLGVLVSKELDDRPYDKDMILTYKKSDSTTYKHVVCFGKYYRIKK
jgi:hypothetical protein